MAEPDQEQLARDLEEQLMSLRIEDVLIQSLVTVSSIGFRRLGVTADSKDDRDLAQSQLAIAVIEALTPVLEGFLPAQLASDFKGSGSQLKLAYARAVSEEGGATAAEPGPTDEPAATEEAATTDEPAATDEPAPTADESSSAEAAETDGNDRSDDAPSAEE